jgi:DNA-binding GntR family transcriptional regulator
VGNRQVGDEGQAMRPATGGGPPRYQEIMKAISDDIAAGRVAVGARLPTEQELCVQHGVGRHTVREAIRGLVEVGMVERRPRLGTRVISAEPIGGYRWLPGSAEDIATNVNATWIVRPRATVVEADEAIARRLGCDVGERWFRFAGPRILRDRSSREPVCFSEQYVPDTPAAREAIATPAMSAGDVAHQVIEQEIRADLLDGEQAAALRAAAGSAALVVVRRHRNPDGRLVAIGIHTHPSDRFSITMTLSPETDGGRRHGQQPG